MILYLQHSNKSLRILNFRSELLNVIYLTDLIKASLYPQLSNASNEWTAVFIENRTSFILYQAQTI